MNRNSYVGLFVVFLLTGVLQVTILRNLVLFDYASCFIYLLPLLVLPMELSAVSLLLIGFLFGISIDTFYDTPGIHAGSCVLIMYLRPAVLRLLTPGGGYDTGTRLTPADLGWGWFTSYVLPLVFVHHLALFFIESGNLEMFWLTLGKAISSTIFTLLVSLVFMYISSRPKGSRL